MTDENSPAKPGEPLRARRWSGAGRPRGNGSRPHRRAFRLIGIPILAVVGAYLFYGLRGYFELPKCDSDRAKQSLAQVLKQLRLEPTSYTPIATVSSSKDQVVCNAVLPLPNNAKVVADFTFYWEANKVQMKYSISRKSP